MTSHIVLQKPEIEKNTTDDVVTPPHDAIYQQMSDDTCSFFSSSVCVCGGARDKLYHLQSALPDCVMFVRLCARCLF